MARTILADKAVAVAEAQIEIERLEFRRSEIMSLLNQIDTALAAAQATVTATTNELKQEARK